MSMGLIERILRLTKERGMSPRAVSLAAGMSPSAVRDIVKRPGSSPSTETVRKLAVALGTTPEYLAYGTGGADGAGIGSEGAEAGAEATAATKGDLQEVKTSFVPATYAGIVEAGAFRPVDEFNDLPGIEPIAVTRDRDFPFAKLVYFDVAGDSMNDLKPRPILAGDRLICVDYEASISRLPFRDGMVVVVEQVTGGGHLRERSVKQLEIHGDRHEFRPRSTNRKHKPIVVQNDAKADDGRMVRIVAIVRSIVNEVPLS